MVDRTELLLVLYQVRKGWFRDTRQLNNTCLMNKRQEEIKASISTIPVKKRAGEFKDYKRLMTEWRMIEIKKKIYAAGSYGNTFSLRWLERSDVGTAKEESLLSSYDKERLALRQTLLLMSILYRNYDDERLQKIVGKTNKLLLL
jgi:hypothetical protein